MLGSLEGSVKAREIKQIWAATPRARAAERATKQAAASSGCFHTLPSLHALLPLRTFSSSAMLAFGLCYLLWCTLCVAAVAAPRAWPES